MCQRFNWLPSSSESPPQKRHVFFFGVCLFLFLPSFSNWIHVSIALYIYTSNIPNAFSIFDLLLFCVVFVNSSGCRRQLWCEQAKDLRRFLLAFFKWKWHSMMKMGEKDHIPPYFTQHCCYFYGILRLNFIRHFFHLVHLCFSFVKL